MHGFPHGHLDGFHIESACLAALPKNQPEQLA
jgi:hypothetical protein